MRRFPQSHKLVTNLYCLRYTIELWLDTRYPEEVDSKEYKYALQELYAVENILYNTNHKTKASTACTT